MLTTEQFASTQKANAEMLLGLTGKAFECVENLVALNLQVAKAALSDVEGNTLTALNAKDPQALLSLQSNVLQPSAEKAAAYARQVYDIAASMKAEITKVVGEATGGAQSSFQELFEAAAKNAPAGSENGVALWKSVMSSASNAFEGMQKAAQQATDMAEANYTAATTQAVKATTSKAKRSAA